VSLLLTGPGHVVADNNRGHGLVRLVPGKMPRQPRKDDGRSVSEAPVGMAPQA
jgi:hypothetical protein